MINHIIFQLTMLAYLLSSILYFLFLGTRKERIGQAGSWVALLGLAINTAAMVIRYVESHRLGIRYVPLSNMYESMIFFAWAIVGLHLLFERSYRLRSLGALSMPMGFLTTGVAVLALSPEIRPLMPALQSSWLVYHVITSFLGYGAFAISFSVSLLYLFKNNTSTRTGLFADHKTLETSTTKPS